MKFRKLSRRYALEDLYDEADAHFTTKKTKFTKKAVWFFGSLDVSITETKFKDNKKTFTGNETKEEKLKEKTKFWEDVTTE